MIQPNPEVHFTMNLCRRFRIMASTTLGDRSPSEISLEKVDVKPTPPASPRNAIPAVTVNPISFTSISKKYQEALWNHQ